MASTKKVNGGAKDKVLLVEGRDDCFTIMHLCGAISCSFNIKECGGIDQVKDATGAELTGSQQLESLGLVVDADDQPIQERWQAVSGLLKPYGFNLPSIPSKSGTITENNGKKVGIWIMPNNWDKGALEDFLLRLADPDGRDAATAYVKNSMDSGVARLNSIHQSKGIVHAYLAIQENPGQPFGTAITSSKAFEVNVELAKLFTNWLTTLFGSNT